MFINIDNKKKVIAGILVVLLIVTLGYLWKSMRTRHERSATSPTVTEAVVKQTTGVAVVPKASETDNDLEVNQRYRASINGSLVDVPVTTTGATKTVVTQEIDMTKVINTATAIERERVRKEYVKNWEVGVGVGSHEGDLYIPIELQRNYAPNKAIAAEIHLAPKGQPRINGWEVKHKWKF